MKMIFLTTDSTDQVFGVVPDPEKVKVGRSILVGLRDEPDYRGRVYFRKKGTLLYTVSI